MMAGITPEVSLAGSITPEVSIGGKVTVPEIVYLQGLQGEKGEPRRCRVVHRFLHCERHRIVGGEDIVLFRDLIHHAAKEQPRRVPARQVNGVVLVNCEHQSFHAPPVLNFTRPSFHAPAAFAQTRPAFFHAPSTLAHTCALAAGTEIVSVAVFSCPSISAIACR